MKKDLTDKEKEERMNYLTIHKCKNEDERKELKELCDWYFKDTPTLTMSFSLTEEELAKACSCNIRELLRYTQCSSKSELKSKFIKNPSCVLNHPNFDINKLWATPLIENLSDYQDLQINASNLATK